jgi:hypothetical protein
LEQLEGKRYSNDPRSVLMKVNGCDMERGEVHERPLPLRSTDCSGSLDQTARAVRQVAAFLGRSPDTATVEGCAKAVGCFPGSTR